MNEPPSQSEHALHVLEARGFRSAERAQLAACSNAEDHPPRRQRDREHEPQQRGDVVQPAAAPASSWLTGLDRGGGEARRAALRERRRRRAPSRESRLRTPPAAGRRRARGRRERSGAYHAAWPAGMASTRRTGASAAEPRARTSTRAGRSRPARPLDAKRRASVAGRTLRSARSSVAPPVERGHLRERRQARAHADGIRAERAGLIDGPDRRDQIHEIRAAGIGRHGKPSANHFAVAHEIGTQCPARSAMPPRPTRNPLITSSRISSAPARAAAFGDAQQPRLALRQQAVVGGQRLDDDRGDARAVRREDRDRARRVVIERRDERVAEHAVRARRRSTRRRGRPGRCRPARASRRRGRGSSPRTSGCAERPVAARATRSADITASVPDETKRMRSTHGSRLAIHSASSSEYGSHAPNDQPSSDRRVHGARRRRDRRARGSAGRSSGRSRCSARPSTSTSSAPWPRAKKHGHRRRRSRNARTGLWTPPGVTRCAGRRARPSQ